jgi:radical SAM superfamily enzyme YgiQ (UPF0313 family)
VGADATADGGAEAGLARARRERNGLLVYPRFPPSYWGYGYALEFVDKKSNMPPLGLLTVAGMFPPEWSLRLVDLNVEPLSDADLEWADAVFTSSMIVQKASVVEVIERANRAGVPVVAGGPHPTAHCDELTELFGTGRGVDHFLLGEVEEIFPEFLRDFESGRARRRYRPASRPDIADAPPPRFDLIDSRVYGSMALQFSRGCPFDCEFCDITELYGRVPRTKSSRQMLDELELLYRSGFRGSLFLVDDNFIGNKRDALRLLLALREWQRERDYPFTLFTEASVNLAEMPELMDAMRDAGFNMVFVGIESPDPDALLKTAKSQNTGQKEETARYLLGAVRRIQSRGMEVSGGFIIGLDGDREFDSHLEFIREAGIPMAMTGMLTALKGTQLHRRLEREGRLCEESTGCNTEIALNFEPELPRQHLLAEYRRVIASLYDPGLRSYFDRCLRLFEHLAPLAHDGRRVGYADVRALLRSLRRQLFSRQGPAYARFLLAVLAKHRQHFAEAIRLAIKGYHFEKITRQQLAVDELKALLDAELEVLRSGGSEAVSSARLGRLATQVRRRRRRFARDFRQGVDDVIDAFHRALAAPR